MRRHLPKIAVALMLVALAFALRERARLPESPEDAIAEFFDAAARGDDAACLRLVTGELQATLAETRSRLGVDAFRDSLGSSTAGIKGLAVSPSSGAPSGFAAFDVDLVFTDRQERQRMLLTEEAGGWAIVSLGAAAGVEPLVPYGTPVFDTPPRYGR